MSGGDAPTKEMPLHSAFYDTRQQTGAVVHLHATHSVAWSMLDGVDPDNVLPPLTAYSIMRLGKVKLLPVFLPGDPKMGDMRCAGWPANARPSCWQTTARSLPVEIWIPLFSQWRNLKKAPGWHC